MKQRILITIAIFFWICINEGIAQSYQTHQQQLEAFQELSARSDLATFVRYGRSAGERELFGLQIGRGEIENKPGLLVIGGIEADDLASTEASQAFAEFLINHADKDSVGLLLDQASFYIIPRASPDPLDGYFERPKTVRAGNDKQQDSDRDGLLDEDGPEDLNGDGRITMMRVLEDAGTYIQHPDEPFILKNADRKAGEVGKYSVHIEGRDNDRDRRINEDSPGGINLNRNMTYDYKPYTTDGGIHPFSSPEAKALGDFVFERRNIIATFIFGPNDNIQNAWKIKWPEERTAPNQFQADSISYSVAVKELKPLLRFSENGGNPGDVSRWAYYHAGTFSFTAPAWAYPAVPDSLLKDLDVEGESLHQYNALHWLRENYPEGTIDWEAIEHPYFPEKQVEIGGFEPFVMNTPPVSEIGKVKQTAIDLLYKTATLLPKLSVDQPEVENMGGDLFKISVTLRNVGVINSFTNSGTRVLAMPYVTARIKLSDDQQILDGDSLKIFQEPIPGGGSHSIEFTVHGKGELSIRVGAPTIGFSELTVNAQ
ncbi:MAG: hypothetical protein GVY07_11490 [Bacteroidetes bacterium]|jgi:hypothetical protein|nr:hypothetical protein [Bacteroidota bacterium]